MLSKEPFIYPSHVKILLYRYWLEYKQVARGFVISDVLERLLFFIAFGFGLGRAVREMENVSYIEFLAPGIAASIGVFTMTYAMTYGVWERSKHNSVWQSWLATPIRLQDILFTEMIYASLRSLPSVVILYAVAYGFGALVSVKGALLALPVLLFANLMYGAITLIFTGMVSRILYFMYVKGLWMMPMYLFSGVFFDLGQTPSWLQVVSSILSTHTCARYCPALNAWSTD